MRFGHAMQVLEILPNHLSGSVMLIIGRFVMMMMMMMAWLAARITEPVKDHFPLAGRER